MNCLAACRSIDFGSVPICKNEANPGGRSEHYGVAATILNESIGYALAKKLEHGPLIAGMTGWLANIEVAAGRLPTGKALFEQALACGAELSGPSMAVYPMVLYWQGNIRESLLQGREFVATCGRLADHLAGTFGKPHLGLALAASGRYQEAAQVFEEARQLARNYEIWPLYIRATAMSAGESHHRLA